MSEKTKPARIVVVLLMVGVALFHAHSLFAETRVFGVWRSRQNPEITVDLYGMPFAGASVEVYRGFGPQGEPPKAAPLIVLISDTNGHVVLPRLPHGGYYILARSKPNREDHLYLAISGFGHKWPDLVLNLVATSGSAEWVLARVGTMEHPSLISSFQGAVEDLDGAPMPNADIDVFVKALGMNQQAIRLQSDINGRFSANLADGQYVVHSWKGIMECIVPVDISSTATSRGLQIKLNPKED